MQTKLPTAVELTEQAAAIMRRARQAIITPGMFGVWFGVAPREADTADALAEAGLLARETFRSIDATMYHITPAGLAALLICEDAQRAAEGGMG
jgi:hypothetical protein